MKKILNYNDLSKEIEKIRLQGSIVLVGGCFDILHEGHTKFLEEAKKQGDILFILLESDESVKKRKGNTRPINTQRIRASILASLSCVDYILLLPHFTENDDYYKLTKCVKPDIIAVTENDPLLEIKQDQARMVEGRVIEVLKRIPNKSTSQLVENIQE